MTRMTSKDQITIPKRSHDYLGLKPGSEVEFTIVYRTYFPGIELIALSVN